MVCRASSRRFPGAVRRSSASFWWLHSRTQTVTNVITETAVYSINFDGTNLTKRLYLDLSVWQGCPHCIMLGMALSPSAGSGALYGI
jgi:hypothetical protein